MRHGLQDHDKCSLCDQEQETAHHLVAGRVFAREVWYRVLATLELAHLSPPPGTSVVDWWLQSRLRLGQQRRRGYDSLLILGAWCLWKECNRRVFDNVRQTAVAVTDAIHEEVDRCQAGYSHLAALWASSASA